MHLLQLDDDDNLSLTNFSERDIPPFAILSHTWGPDSVEVTFEDIVNGSGEAKSGIEKIRFCGERARQDGLSYFWVDTCCINKKNHAELARSINSMFRWYRNAARCYVYMTDISLSMDDGHNYNRPLESQFRQSRWFTRGWTLQELLAPVSVEFFSQEHRRLGDKNSLREQICEITNIPPTALRGHFLSQFSFEERMRWVQHRQTKLEEDKVYSLLGIFGVYIFPIYGEGLVNAHARLLDEFHKMQKCIQDLRLSDPRHDRKRIEDSKGGLLEGLSDWILEDPGFQQWRRDQQSRLLWIKGDPGKGKTMLLCGIINELQRSTVNSELLAYFFCQATDARINHATAVLRGLMYQLVSQQPSLITHIRTKYSQVGKTLFEDANAWVALSEIFTTILQDPSLDWTYLVVDALDECTTDLPKMLAFLVHILSVSPRVKWIVSSRNWPSIEKRLDHAPQKLKICLELNEKSVSTSIAAFIKFKVDWLKTQNKYSHDIANAIKEHLTLNANGTFLWVALVCQELSTVSGWKVRQKLAAVPAGLNAFYQRMISQIMNAEDAELCKRILAVVSTVYRPVTLDELETFVDMPDGVAGDHEALSEIVGLCGSFLALRERTVSFVHQSAKEFLIESAAKDIFPSTLEIHSNLFLRSLQAMSRTLCRNVYGLAAPGIYVTELKLPVLDPLAAVQYACLYWVQHLQRSGLQIHNNDTVHQFLRKYLLYWLEALGWMGRASEGIMGIISLDTLLSVNQGAQVRDYIHDVKRFALYNRHVIEHVPLQLYCSGLIFAPAKSIVRKEFNRCIPNWARKVTNIRENWDSALQTLEGHTGPVSSVAFSPDCTQVASGSDDNTVRLWDARTGALQSTLEGHTSRVNSIAFSPDGTQVASGSYDNTVRLWDVRTGALQSTLEGHTDFVRSIAFSPDGTQVASGSYDNTVRLWGAQTGALQSTLEGNTSWVNSIAFSPDGTQVASGSGDKTIRLWDARTGALQSILEGNTSWVNSIAFSPDGTQVASGSGDKTIRLWDARTGALQSILEGHTSWVNSIAFSPDGTQVASGSDDKTIRLWDARTGALQSILEGHTSWVNSIAFSPDGTQVASGSGDETIRLWKTRTGALQSTLEGHTSRVRSIAFSPDGTQVASGSDDNTVRLWDVRTGALQSTLEGHTSRVRSIAFSPDGTQVASGSDDKTIRLWDAQTGALQSTLEGHTSWVNSIAFSPDGTQVASGSYDMTIRLWDARTGALQSTLEGHTDFVKSVVFSPGGTLLPAVHTSKDWLVDGTVNVLWLPPEYRPTCEAVSGRTIALGHASGKVSLFILASASNPHTV